MTEVPNFSTRITEAEEKALEAVRALGALAAELVDPFADGPQEDALRDQWQQLWELQKAIATAAALARDYARREV